MKSRRLQLENPVSNGGGFNLFVMENSGNHSFDSPFSGVRLADNSSAPSPPHNSSDPYGFILSVSIITVVVVSVFFLMGIFTIYVRRCASGLDRAVTENFPVLDYAHGLGKAIIKNFPVFSYDLVKHLKAQTTLECAICLNEFEDDEQVRLLPKCSHAFHPECIDMWLFSHTTCPVCRTSLVPTDDANPTSTGDVIIEPPNITPPAEVTVVVDGGRSISRRGRSVRRDEVVESPVAPERADSQEPLYVIGFNPAKIIYRSHSTGHSPVRLPRDLEQPATEPYICTEEGLSPGLHENCSLTAPLHFRFHGPSTYKSRPALSKQDSMISTASCRGDAGTSSGSGFRWHKRKMRLERPSMPSMNPASFLRTHSEHRAPSYSRFQESSAGSQQEQKAYLPSLKNTLKMLTGRDREWIDYSQSGRRSSTRAVDNSQSEGGSFTGAADNSQSGPGSFTNAADESVGPVTAWEAMPLPGSIGDPTNA